MFFNKKKLRAAIEKSFGKVKTETFNFKMIERYHKNKDNTNAFQVISDQTCEDLDFNLFFKFLDRTSSKIGQLCLYQELRAINYNPEKINTREKIIEFFQKNPEKRIEIQHLLSNLNSTKTYFLTELFQENQTVKPKWFFIIPLLSIFSFSSFILSFFNPNYLVFLFILFPIHIFIHYALKLKVNLIVDSIPQLIQLNKTAKKLLKFEFPLLNGEQKSINIIEKINRKMFVFKFEKTTLDDINVVGWLVKEIIKITFLIEPIISFGAAEKINKNKKEIENVFSMVGEIDILISIACLRENLEFYCLPIIEENNKSLHAKNMIHPLIDNCIPNSFDSGINSFLLTGSNMSGKTTFIRAIGLNCISGIALNTCFANEFSFPLLKIHSVIRIADDITSASSYFFKEVEAMKVILEECEKSHFNLILLDELFKGTNTIERIASAKAILSHINQKNNFVFVSTHDIELTILLEKEYDLFYFGETILNNEINFDYQLKKGVPKNGNAIKILDINGFPKQIIHEANSIVNQLSTI
jgi:DNA mismatch repair ATPase MutS